MCHHQVSKMPTLPFAGMRPVSLRYRPSTSCKPGDSIPRAAESEAPRSVLEQMSYVNVVADQYQICSPSIGSRFEEPGSRATHDLVSLSTLDQMNLQQEFEEDADHAANKAAMSARSQLTQSKAACSQLTQEGQHKEVGFTDLPAGSHTSRSPRAPLPPADAWSGSDSWGAPGSVVDSVEASLRRRLLGTSSTVAPISVLSATSRNRESASDLLYYTRQLKSSAANRLEKMVTELSLGDQDWAPIILHLAQEACKTVNPDVRRADSMDIRPYIKIKLIPGGTLSGCRYVDGIVFRKDVVHKMMKKGAYTPRILLLAGGIDFQRAHSKLASFSTLIEQEQKYTEIIVEKIVRLRPHLLFVGHSISRQAQEYLHEHDVIAIQRVKPKLMQRIARMTGAVILSSTDHVTSMSQYRHTALGSCQRFQIAKYPSAPLEASTSTEIGRTASCDSPHLKRVRGHGYISYVYLTGSPKVLGCTLVLRGANISKLKQIKQMVRFAVFIAYHLRLECSFFKDAGAMLPLSTATRNTKMAEKSTEVDGTLLSSSLAVDFGDGAIHSQAFSSGAGTHVIKNLPVTSAFDHQSLLVTSVWMSQRAQCASAEVKGILYYTPQDVCLGQFLLDSCFNVDLKFPHGDKKSVLDITQIFYHNDGRIPITVVKMDQPIPGNVMLGQDVENSRNPNYERTIYMWSYCKRCERIVTPLIPMSEDTWKMSFGKFLEVRFYNMAACCRTGGCRHCLQTEHVFYYGCQSLVARFDYERIQPYDICVRKQLPFDSTFHYNELASQYIGVQNLGITLFHSFHIKHTELEAVLDASTPMSEFKEFAASLRAAVLAELSQISHELQSYSKWLQSELAGEVARHDKLSRQINLRTMQFPTQFRRELYIRSSNWNQRFSLLGQLLNSTRDQVRPPAGAGTDPSHAGAISPGSIDLDFVLAELLRLQNLTEPTYVSSSAIGASLALDEDADDAVVEEDEGDEFHEDAHPEEPELGSKHDLTTTSPESLRLAPSETRAGNNALDFHNKELAKGDRPSFDTPISDLRESSLRPEGEHDSGLNAVRRPTADAARDRAIGGATLRRGYKISSAFARLLGKDSPEEDPWIVPLGELEGGRPRLEAGDRGEVLLVHEEQPTTIIAYSLSTLHYRRALATYMDSNEQQKTYTCESSMGGERAIGSTLRLTAIVAPCEPSCPENVDSYPWAGGLASLLEQDSTANPPACNHRPTLDPVETLSALFRRPTNLVERNNVNSRTASSDDCDNTSPICPSKMGVLHGSSTPPKLLEAKQACPTDLEWQMLSPHKTHIKHRFADVDEKGDTLCKFVCQAYWATQFAAVRQAYCGRGEEEELGFLRSLTMARPWNAQGGKSGATFLKSTDGRFVVKQITRTELQMFLEYAPAYFEYLSKAFFHRYSTLLVKVLGVYQIGSHNRVNGKRIMEQVVVMENLFHERLITRAFDLKGSTRSRYARVNSNGDMKIVPGKLSPGELNQSAKVTQTQPVLLDENFVEFTEGRPLPLHDQAKAYFNNAVLNDTLFLSLINVVDYSILVGMDDENHQLVVGIIDYMRQYDIVKKMERMGKSVGMIAGQAEPTVIQPPNYRNRFQAAMEKYFMMVPDKWTSFRLLT